MVEEEHTLVDQIPRTLRSEVRVNTRGQGTARVPTLTMVTGPTPGRFVNAGGSNRAIFIGRDATCDFAIEDSSISRKHARIYLETLPGRDAQVVIQDLDSTNGTIVNGDPINRQVLNHGDRIHVGDILLRYEVLDSVDIAYRDDVARQIQDSERDPLTQLLRRNLMDEHLPALLEHCREQDWPVSAVILDLDHFKSINDTLGHAAGDDVLRKTGAIILETVRKDDLAIRYGGEEFLLVLPGARRLHARLLAERLREAIAQTSFPALGDRRVTASLGVAERAGGEEFVAWIQRADEALYRAKERGRNRSEAAPMPTTD